jgi:hypothetical protein
MQSAALLSIARLFVSAYFVAVRKPFYPVFDSFPV